MGKYAQLNVIPKSQITGSLLQFAKRQIGEPEICHKKDVILQVCKQRGDKWAEGAQVRSGGSLSDLHASEARYHLACRDKFMPSKNK